MEKKKLIAVSLSAIAVVGTVSSVAFIGVSNTLAADSNSGYPQIVKNLAAKFNVSESEIQTVFEDTRKQRMSDKLDQAVADGKITADQKALIIAKREEVKAKMDEIDSKQLTAEERRAAVKAVMEEQKKWMEENNIPVELVRPHLRGVRGPQGGEMKEGRGMRFSEEM